MILPSTLQSARSWISYSLPRGGTAVDATVGNGYDTLFLAEQVGPEGVVFGFDIQQEAIESTARRLREAGRQNQVRLFPCSHHRMDEKLPAEVKGKIQGMMFNLGYLPHGNPEIITQPQTTIEALQIGTVWLAPGGMITLALYTGHPGGQEEADAVVNWASALPPKQFQVMWQQMVNRRHAPSLLVIEKR
ncbi:class I SAM-dependent methyltransferase [Paenactinomyces guangxiensis]|uniref:Class I SAM-dependent methyltransferase n=1 Tax=Paenactinomyces guangxiensis TaxID=1490290 RepID=A0A7W1WRR4_9BACL|nr:class I SAM-dependent methyltransferase [Paenactinomyces guangxiensis]MBA4494856.1 class I SAM-dependent methyltransferase [Paenactinomyces guangxiensis]MBH8591939.1 class I SAM-dependent methyltransferase [Paenactinomyces guangxiensis]